MCGLFAIIPKSAANGSESEGDEEVPKDLPKHRPTPKQVQVNRIMGVPSNYRSGSSGSRHNGREKGSVDGSLENASCKPVLLKGIETSKYPSRAPMRPPYRPREIGSMREGPTISNGAASRSPQRRVRPRMYERREYPSSPLANIGTRISTRIATHGGASN